MLQFYELVVIFFSIEDVVRLNVAFTILHEKNGFPKVIKYGNLLLNKGSKSMFIKLLLYFYTKIQQPINLYINRFNKLFMFEAQINYMCDLYKISKW